MAAFQYANPCFLKQILGESGVAGEEKQIAVETLLILFNEAIQQVGIAAPQTRGNGLAFVSHEPGEEHRGPRNRKRESLCTHTNWNTRLLGKKTHSLLVKANVSVCRTLRRLARRLAFGEECSVQRPGTTAIRGSHVLPAV